MVPEPPAPPALPASAPLRGTLRWPGALRHRNFRLFFFGQLVSLVGTWMQSLAQAWQVQQLTHEPIWLGIVAAAQFLPVLLIGLFGGLIADLLPKRRTVMATQAASMVLAFVLAGLTWAGVIEVWMILLVAVLLGFVTAVDMPARQSFTIEMVGREDVTNAVGLGSASFNAARIVGPAVGGLVIAAAAGDVAPLYFLNGASFVAVLLGLSRIRPEALQTIERLQRPANAREVFAQLGEGIACVRSTPVILLAVVVVGVVSTAAMNFNVLGPPYAEVVLRVGPAGLGFLMAAMGLGALVAALAVASIARPRPWVIVVGGAAAGLIELAMSQVRAYPLALVAMFLVGFATIGMMITANTSIQLAAPDRLRGRVMAVYTTVFAGTTPFGSPAVGAIASTWGTPTALAVSGGVALVASGLGALWMRRRGPEPFTFPAAGTVVAGTAAAARRT